MNATTLKTWKIWVSGGIGRSGWLLLMPLVLAGCADQHKHAQSIYMLVDTSGTYVQESHKATLIINYMLGILQPGDSLAVARVESRSFSEKDILAKVTFDARPSQANAQKRTFRDQIEASMHDIRGSAHTDITGGLIQGAEFLDETGAGKKTILIFSDMQEDLDKVTVRNFPLDLKGIRVIAVNVTKLRSDNIDPRLYLNRLDWWHKRVQAAGATEWRVINDLEHLDAVLDSRA